MFQEVLCTCSEKGVLWACSIEPVKNCMEVLGWMYWACPISCANIFILSPGVLRSTLSYIWCKLNLPIFLLMVGLLTLIYIDSLIVLAMAWPSLPIIWKLSCVVVWPVLWLWLCIGDGSFRCTLKLFKGPRGLPYIFLITCKVPTLEPVDGPTFIFHGFLSLGEPGGFYWCCYL